MKIDLIFSTLNGGRRLSEMLAGLCQLDIQKGCLFRIIAVDNGSTDQSVSSIEHYADRLPIKLIHQTKPGKNAALNLALQYSHGDLVVFTDDDIIPQKDWITELSLAAEENPQYDLFGGRVTPKWPRVPPARLVREVPLGPAFAVTPDSITTGSCDASRVWGNNMAVRQCVFREGHRFDETVGPCGEDYVMGGETEFLARCQKAGHLAFFVQDAVVQHIIREEQLSTQWLRGRGYRFGRKLFHEERKSGKIRSVSEWAGTPRWMLRSQFTNRIRASLPFSQNFFAAWQAGFFAGYRHEYRNWRQIKSLQG